MKLKLLLFFTALTNLAHAQVDVSLKTVGLLAGQLGVETEYILKDNLGISLGVYSSDLSIGTLLNGMGDEVYDAKQFSITPEVRFYYDPDDTGDGRYFGIYLRNINNKSRNILITDEVYTYNGYVDVTSDYTHTFNQTFIGLNFGYKRTFGSDDKFFVNYNYGIGASIHHSITWNDPSSPVQTYSEYYPEKEEFKTSLLENNFTDKIDLRMNFAIGYRFGNGSSKSKSSTKKSDDI